MRVVFHALCSGLAALATASTAQPAAPRLAPPAGAVVSRVSGEEARFVEESDFRALVLGQDLVGGDLVRTGPIGVLGIRFADLTVMRLHPNSELVVRRADAASAELTLNAGRLWGRAPRASAAVTVATPTAAAAIRGTDWALSVEAGDVTRVEVYDGVVTLSNDLGVIDAAAGEQAVAEPGRAPFKVQVANRREASQMLFAAPAGAAVEPISAAAAEAGPPTGPGAADYAAGLAAMRAGDFAAAARLLDAAAAGLDAGTAQAALWIAYFARIEDGIPASPPAPATSPEGRSVAALARGYAAASRGDLAAAAAALAEAPSSPTAVAAGVEIAIARDAPDEAATLLKRLQALAPGGSAALAAEAAYLAQVAGDIDRAIPLLTQAVALDPENATLWNALGLARDAADHPLEAEAALRRAVALAPADPIARGNLAILLLDQTRHAEAREEIDRTLARDPGSYLGLRAAARLAAHEGRDAEALRLGLDALAAQPAAAETSILLGIAAYQAGDRARAEQEFDAAARLDPNDAVVPEIRAQIAVDDARADDAIVFARESARLYRQAGTGVNRLAADRRSGSALFQAFDNLSLDGWARDVSDRTFDPLSANSLITEGLLVRSGLDAPQGSASPLGGGSVIQALLLDPLAVSARVRRSDVLRRPFVDAELTAGRTLDAIDGWSGAAQAQGFVAAPAPFAFALAASGLDLDEPDVDGVDGNRSASGVFGFQPTARFGGFGFLAYDRTDADQSKLPGRGASFDDATRDSWAGGLGGNLRLSARRVLTIYGQATAAEEDALTRRPLFPGFDRPRLDVATRRDVDTQFAGLSYRATDPDGFWIAGVEGDRTRDGGEQRFALDNIFTGGVDFSAIRTEETVRGARAYVARRQRVTPEVEVEGGLSLSIVDGEDDTQRGVSPRVGVAWTPSARHRLRLAALQEQGPPGFTLGPFTVLGLAPLAAPVRRDGEVSAVIARYDGELTDRLHLSLEHQSLWFEGLSFATGDALNDFDAPESRLHQAELRADYWLGHGVGVFAAGAVADSKITSGPGDGQRIPGAPDRSARVGLTWVHPLQIRGSLEGVYLGRRFGDPNGGTLDDDFSVNASLAFEPFDKRLRVAVEARDIFDAAPERAFGLTSPGRTVVLTGSVRF